MKANVWIVSIVAALFLAGSADAAKTKSAPSPLPGSVQGVVVRGGNAVVKGARVTLRAKRGRHRGRGTRHTVTGEQGHFSLQVPAGRYLLLARKRGEGRAKVSVNVVAHQTQQTKLVLHARHHGHHHHHRHTHVVKPAPK